MKTITGDLLQLALDGTFDVIVHGCNCQCQMGKGIALSIKRLFPEAFAADQATAKGDAGKLGTISVAEIQRDGNKADYAAIAAVMREVKKQFKGKRIGYPKIGAGLAGGDWARIVPIIEEELAGEDHTFVEFVAAEKT